MKTPPAIAFLEFDSVAVGTRVADAMIKRAPIEKIRIGTVQPGKFLILVGGSVAATAEAHTEGLRVGADSLTDEVFLPDVHQQVYESIEGKRRSADGDALGIIETSCIPANVRAADRAIKMANVTVMEIRLGDGLGGRGITHLTGKLEDVQAAVEAGIESVRNTEIVTRSVVIPRQDLELRERVEQSTSFFG